MRLSGLIIFVVLVLTIGFLYLGFSAPEFSYRTQIDVRAPVEETFTGFTDTTRMTTWMSGLIKVQLLRGEPDQAGGVYRLTIREDDADEIVTRQIIGFEPNTRVAFDLEDGTMNSSVDVLFESTPSGTLIAVYNTVRGKGLYWRALLRLRRNAIMERQRADFRRFKAMIENG